MVNSLPPPPFGVIGTWLWVYTGHANGPTGSSQMRVVYRAWAFVFCMNVVNVKHSSKNELFVERHIKIPKACFCLTYSRQTSSQIRTFLMNWIPNKVKIIKSACHTIEKRQRLISRKIQFNFYSSFNFML